MNNEFIIQASVAEAVLNYLAKQPYKDVAHLINALQRMQPVEEKAVAKPPVVKKDTANKN